MHFGLIDTLKLKDNDCLVLGLFADKTQPKTIESVYNCKHSLDSLPPSFKEVISRLSQKMNDAGDLIWQSDIEGRSMLLIHCGDESQWTQQTMTKRMSDITQALKKQRIPTATICLPPIAKMEANTQLQHMIVALDTNLYQMLEFKSQNKKTNTLESVHFILPGASVEGLQNADAVTQGIRLTRNLANLPANICTPTYLAKQALELAKQHSSIKTQVMDREAMKKMGMGALLAVAQGSTEPPQFIEIHYNGSSKTAPIILVGKGVTFDSGGISLKPPSGMEEMKFDMAGAASVLGTLKACAMMKLPIQVIGLIPTTENMPSGSATKPGDIVTSMSGQTIEIVNTDAEGRLILADALTYAERFKPEFVIDIATLTGAIIVSLGHETTGLFTPDEALADTILSAARESGDASWRMPIQEVYQELIDSPLADMANSTADRTAGSVTAACFLSRYTKKYRWAHLDIAGTAWVSGKNRNATGRPVPLLIQIIKNASHAR